MELKQIGKGFHYRDRSVLIVPYGIETRKYNEYQVYHTVVLIVPYGIET